MKNFVKSFKLKKNNLNGKIKRLLLLAVFCLCTLGFSFATTITIDSASSTEYTKNQDTGEDEIVLTGSVSISVTSSSSKVVISADLVTYNRVTQMLFAQGNVTLLQSDSSGGGESITAASLLFNTATLEGVFDNGRVVQVQSDAINLPSGSTLIVNSQMFGRDSSSTIAFKNGELTFCDDENPHWKIKASKIWLLPGGEFAFFNAVLYVGQMPILYLPAFYYPKDELVFNPSFGTDERRGKFLQTTTYILGRKPLDSSSSGDDVGAALFNFMKSSTLKEQVREGLVLHNLDENYKGDTSSYLKVKADYYSNLGAMFGLEGVFKPQKYITNLSASLNIAFSNTVFYDSSYSTYTPYSSAGKIYHDSSNFMGMILPFRYSANLSLTMNRPFNLTLSLPLYSDKAFQGDFEDRSEYLDWIGMFLNDDDDDSTSTISSFTWSLSSSYTIPLPEKIKPYVSNFSLSSLSASMLFSSATNSTLTNENSDSWISYTPEKYFFYPSQVIPVKASFRIAGTLFDIGSSKTKKVSNVKWPLALTVPEDFLTDEEKENPASKNDNTALSEGKEASSTKEAISLTDDASLTKDEKPGEESVSSAKEAASSTDAASSATDTSDSALQKTDPELTFIDNLLPQLTSAAPPSVTSIQGLTYKLDYSITPSFISQINYSSSSLQKPEDFDWSNIYSTYYQIKIPVTLTSNFSYRSSFFTIANTLNFNPVFQGHPNLNGYSQESALSVKKTDYSAKKLDLTETNSISFKPFINTLMFKNTSLSWNSTIKIVRTEFLGDADNPKWEYLTMDLTDDECVTVHTLSANIAASQGENFSQSLTLSTTLPPQLDSYTANLSLTFPYITLNFAGGIEKSTSDTDAVWEKDPFQESATLKLLKGNLRFTQSFNYNFESAQPESLKFAASYKNLQLAFTMARTYPYTFDSSSGWTAKSEKEFLPSTASLAYSYSSKWRYWKNRIVFAPSVSTSIVYDCLKPTSSYFKFTPSISFKINDFLELSLSADTKNSVIYRYIQGMTNSEYQIAGETNPLVDLFNSFAFWGDGAFYDPDQTKRKASGFKLKSLNLTLTHDLDDWDFSASVSVKPRLTTDDLGKYYYDFTPYFTFAVSWRPMSSIKAEIADEYGKWIMNP